MSPSTGSSQLWASCFMCCMPASIIGPLNWETPVGHPLIYVPYLTTLPWPISRKCFGTSRTAQRTAHSNELITAVKFRCGLLGLLTTGTGVQISFFNGEDKSIWPCFTAKSQMLIISELLCVLDASPLERHVFAPYNCVQRVNSTHLSMINPLIHNFNGGLTTSPFKLGMYE